MEKELIGIAALFFGTIILKAFAMKLIWNNLIAPFGFGNMTLGTGLLIEFLVFTSKALTPKTKTVTPPLPQQQYPEKPIDRNYIG